MITHIIGQAAWGLYWRRQAATGGWPEYAGAFAWNETMAALHIMALEASA